MGKVIKITCKGAMTLPHGKLEDFQGKLKNLTDEAYSRLRKEILEHGFSFPPAVWRTPGGKWKLLDGHQRVHAVKRLVEEGYSIDELPVVTVQAKSEKEAKLKLLAATSQYGEMQRQGLYEFMEDAGLGIEDISLNMKFAEIDLGSFEEEFFGTPERKETVGATEIKEIEFSKFAHKCPKCQFEFNDDRE